jgi:hypothetical protein
MKELYAGKLNGMDEHSVISKEHNVEVIWRLGDDWKNGVNNYSTVIIRDIDETDRYMQTNVHDIKKINLINLLLSGLGIKIVTEKPKDKLIHGGIYEILDGNLCETKLRYYNEEAKGFVITKECLGTNYGIMFEDWKLIK